MEVRGREDRKWRIKIVEKGSNYVNLIHGPEELAAKQHASHAKTVEGGTANARMWGTASHARSLGLSITVRRAVICSQEEKNIYEL